MWLHDALALAFSVAHEIAGKRNLAAEGMEDLLMITAGRSLQTPEDCGNSIG